MNNNNMFYPHSEHHHIPVFHYTQTTETHSFLSFVSIIVAIFVFAFYFCRAAAAHTVKCSCVLERVVLYTDEGEG
jgi:hypothetical protein